MADDYATIRVPESAFEEAKQRKNDANMTWAEYLTDESRGTPDAEDIATELTARINVDADNAKDELNELEGLVNTVSANVDELNDKMGAKTTGSVNLERIMNRLDDLENTIPRKTVEELR